MNIYTQGTFDLFHIGHLKLLERCRDIANEGKVIVGLLSDEAIEKYKGSVPIIPYEYRKEVLMGCRYVDMVEKSDIYDIEMKILNPFIDFIIVGSDWAKKDLATHYGVDKDMLEDKLIYLPYTDKESSTKIKERIQNAG